MTVYKRSDKMINCMKRQDKSKKTHNSFNYIYVSMH